MKGLLVAAIFAFVGSLKAAHNTSLYSTIQSDIDIGNNIDVKYTKVLAALWNSHHYVDCLGRYTVGELIEHPRDCHKFLSCVADRLVELSCPVGQYFANDRGICILDEENICPPYKARATEVVSTNCSEIPQNICNSAQNMDTKPDTQNCTNYFLCMDGEPIPQTCLTGQFYDPAQSKCAADVNAVCINPCPNQAGEITLPNPICTNFYLCNNGNVSVQTCSTGTFDALTGKCSLNGTCITALCVNQSDWVTYAVPNSNTQFYQCIDHVPVLRNCDANAIYDDSIGACMLKPSVQCDQNICSSASYDGNAFPTNNKDSTEYCYCRNGAAYQESCPTDYYFDVLLRICKSNATCDPEYCLSAPEYAVTPARYQDSSFCLCVTKTPVIVQCPLNGTFNSNSLKCQATGSCDSTYCRTQPDNTVYPSEDNNAGFCVCHGRIGTFEPCDDGQVYDSTLEICRPAALVPTSFSCDVSKCASMRTTIFSIENNPYNFCFCNGATKVIQRSCPTDSYFDATLLVCVSRQNAVAASTLGCSLSVCSNTQHGRVHSIAAKTTDRSFCYCLSEEKVISLDCPAGKRYNIRLGVCVDTIQLNYLQPLSNNNHLALWGPKDEHYNCAGGYKHGDFIEHAQDCQRFQVCAFGQLHLMDCGEGNYYDIFNQICDWDRYGLCSRDAETGCMGLYQEGEMIGHNTNAQLYFVCYKHQMLMQDCGPTNIFDVKRQMCVRKENDSNTRKRSPRSTSAVNEQLTQQSLEEKDFMHCEEHTKRSVPSNCTQYEFCVEGTWQRRNCNQLRYYNPEEQKCVEPRDDYVCEFVHISGLPACTYATLHQTHANTRYGKCNSYYRCQADGKWLLVGCPKQQYYAAHLNACIETKYKTSICNVNSTNIKTSGETIKVTMETYDQACQHMTVREDTSDCGMYMLCVDGVWWHTYCGYGMYFNRTFNTCLQQQNNTVSEHCNGNSLRKTCQMGEKRAYPLNCTAYEICNAQAQWERESCLPMHVFDDALLTCVPKLAYTLCSSHGFRRACRDGETRALLNVINGITYNRTHFYYCDLEKWRIGTCLSYSAYTLETATCTSSLTSNDVFTNALLNLMSPVMEANKCVEQHGMLLPDVHNCNDFYVCLNGKVRHESCYDKYYFNATRRQCESTNSTFMNTTNSALVVCPHKRRGNVEMCGELQEGATLPVPGDCRRYLSCQKQSNGVAQIEQRCRNGENYDSLLGRCRQSDGTCLLENGKRMGECSMHHGQLVAHSHNCRGYYVCLHSQKIERFCEAYERFDPNPAQCVRDDGKQCKDEVPLMQQQVIVSTMVGL